MIKSKNFKVGEINNIVSRIQVTRLTSRAKLRLKLVFNINQLIVTHFPLFFA